MKVSNGRLVARALSRTGIAAMVLAATLVLAPASAGAITRAQVVTRARTWVKKRVPYSQSRYHRGYRQDCSGFVSMAWKLGSSYSTHNISSRARRIKKSALKPGDAVLIPGHVSIFAGWKNRKKGRYIALEETTWGSHAKRRVRTIPRNAKFLRRKGLKSTPKRRVVASRPATSTPIVNTAVVTTETPPSPR